MPANWLKGRRIQKLTLEFWDLLGQLKIAEALAFFESRLEREGDALPRQVRAAYHFHRWLRIRSGYLLHSRRHLVQFTNAGGTLFVIGLLRKRIVGFKRTVVD